MTTELNKTETTKAQRAAQQIVTALGSREIEILKELNSIQSQLTGLTLVSRAMGFDLTMKDLPAAAAKAKASVADLIEPEAPAEQTAVVGDEPLDVHEKEEAAAAAQEEAAEPGPDHNELLAVCRERGSRLFKEFKAKEEVAAIFKKVGVDPNAASGPSILNDMTDEQLVQTRDLLGEAVAKHEAKAAAPVETEEDWG